jgi:hypothetical protein
MKPLVVSLAATVLAFCAVSSQAIPLAVDEVTYPGANGDYNNLLNPPLPQAVIFNLGAGTNTFAGTFGTPGDAGDTFVVELGAGDTLTAIRVTFATNAGDFNPVGINQGSQLVFDSASSNSPTPLVGLNLTGKPSAPVTFSSGVLDVGPGLYTTTLLTGVLALLNNGKVGYQVAFDVITATPPVPEPAVWALMFAGVTAMAAAVRRLRAYRRDEGSKSAPLVL